MQACSQPCTEKGVGLVWRHEVPPYRSCTAAEKPHIFRPLFSVISKSCRGNCTALPLFYASTHNTTLAFFWFLPGLAAMGCHVCQNCISIQNASYWLQVFINALVPFINHHQHYSVNVYISNALQSICCILNWYTILTQMAPHSYLPCIYSSHVILLSLFRGFDWTPGTPLAAGLALPYELWPL